MSSGASSSAPTLETFRPASLASTTRDGFSPSKQTSKKMVSQSRLYFALLTTVATMAFWLGMWSNSVSNYDKFTLPKPLRAVLAANDAFTEGKNNLAKSYRRTILR